MFDSIQLRHKCVSLAWQYVMASKYHSQCNNGYHRAKSGFEMIFIVCGMSKDFLQFVGITQQLFEFMWY